MINHETTILDSLTKQPFGAGKEEGEQGSISWLMERVGYCTASRFKDVLDFTKAGKPGAKRTAYLWELVIERLTGKPAQHYTSAAMEHGIANEPLARMAYEAATGSMMTQTGFRKHPAIPYVGGSPDGILDGGGWEAKCPYNPQHHLQCFLTGMPEDHIPQVQGLIWLHDAEFWDFSSFSPEMPPALQLFTVRIMRDAEYIISLESAIVQFLAQVADLHKLLNDRAKGAGA